MRIDMHIHSKYSDGILSMKEITNTLSLNGVRIFALTDHDTVDGIDEGAYEAKKHSLEFIPGIEISAEFENREVHILGYYINHKCPNLINHLKSFKENRYKRVNRIIEKLEQEGLIFKDINLDKEVDHGVLGRPHIADILIEKGYVKTRREAFLKYLSKGTIGYIPRKKITVSQAVSLIKKANGIPVLAHPGVSFLNPQLDEIVKLGLEGIEVWHPDHNLTLIDYFYNYAQKNDLIMTGGTDWHGDKNYKTLNYFHLPYENILRMKKMKRDYLDPVYQNC